MNIGLMLVIAVVSGLGAAISVFRRDWDVFTFFLAIWFVSAIGIYFWVLNHGLRLPLFVVWG